MHTLNPLDFIVVPSKVMKLFYILHTGNIFVCFYMLKAHYKALCMHYAYSACLTFDITSGYTQLLFPSLRHWFFLLCYKQHGEKWFRT